MAEVKAERGETPDEDAEAARAEAAEEAAEDDEEAAADEEEAAAAAQEEAARRPRRRTEGQRLKDEQVTMQKIFAFPTFGRFKPAYPNLDKEMRRFPHLGTLPPVDGDRVQALYNALRTKAGGYVSGGEWYDGVVVRAWTVNNIYWLRILFDDEARKAEPVLENMHWVLESTQGILRKIGH